jgi:hypothetical protein
VGAEEQVVEVGLISAAWMLTVAAETPDALQAL